LRIKEQATRLTLQEHDDDDDDDDDTYMLVIRSSLQKKFDFNESARELVLVKGNFRVSSTSSFCLEAASLRTNMYKLYGKTSVLD